MLIPLDILFKSVVVASSSRRRQKFIFPKKSARFARAALLLYTLFLEALFPDRIFVRDDFSRCSARATRAVTRHI